MRQGELHLDVRVRDANFRKSAIVDVGQLFIIDSATVICDELFVFVINIEALAKE